MTRRKLRAMFGDVLAKKRLWRYRVQRYRRQQEEAAFWASPSGVAAWEAVVGKQSLRRPR